MSLLARSGGIEDEFTFTGGVARNPAAVRALDGAVAENYGERRINISADSIYTGALGRGALCAPRGGGVSVTAGIDVGSSAVKAAVLRVGEGEDRVLGHAVARVRRRSVAEVVAEAFDAAVEAAGVRELDYVASTGEGEETPIATGHFYGMTTHARGALFLDPGARAVLDVGRAPRPRRRDGLPRQGARLQDDEPVRLGVRPVPREHRPLSRRRAVRHRGPLA